MSQEFRPSDYMPTDPLHDDDGGAHKRQPNLGYTLVLLAVGVLALALFSIALGVLGHHTHLLSQNNPAASKELPKASILLEALTFGSTFLFAYLVFPHMWRRPFARVIDWNVKQARAHVGRLALTGVGLSIVAQLLESRLTLPKEMPVDDFFRSPSDVWVIALFGTLVAPVCEELFFRGFLLRGIAIAYDWLATPKTEEGRARWHATDSLSRTGLIVAGVISSGLFAAMHAAQLGFAWNAVGVLWIVGGGLTVVRLRLNSVAASSVVHAVYNGWIFIIIFIGTDGFRHLDKMAAH